MRSHIRKLFIISAIVALYPGISPAQTATKSTSASKTAVSHRRHVKHRKVSWKKHGQQAIQGDRAREIQTALIREHYLNGEASGAWDARTQDAMTRYQSDNGWQTKVTPDSRALIKLGLGPNYSDKDLLNLSPKTASDAVAGNSTGATTTSKQR